MILKDSTYKSYEWAYTPVIKESMFREYDLRNPIKPLMKGTKKITGGVNIDGFRILGQAFGTYIQKKHDCKSVVISSDYRSYSKGLAYAFTTGVMSTGLDVIDIGTQVTPVIYFSQYYLNQECGAMITASHNDNGWSGLKLAHGFSKTFGPHEIKEFKKIVYSEDFIKGSGSYTVEHGLMEKYVQDIFNRIKPHFGQRKLKVVISGGNGIGGLYLKKIMERCGFEVIPVFNEPDWNFPHFNPNPENLLFLKALGDKVRETKADIGLATDGDGDRLGMVDENGNKVYSDRVGLMLARFIAQKEQKEENIIIDVKSTGAFAKDDLLKKYNNKIIFSKTGHSYVKTATQEHDAIAGYEKSGHFFLRKEWGRGYDDATLTAAWAAVIVSNTQLNVSQIIQEQQKSYQSPTMEPSVKDDTEKYIIIEKVEQDIKEMHKNNETFAGLKIKKLITINGIRIVFENGAWGLIRASSNQPVLVVVAESFESDEEMRTIIKAIQEHLRRYDVTEYDQELPEK